MKKRVPGEPAPRLSLEHFSWYSLSMPRYLVAVTLLFATACATPPTATSTFGVTFEERLLATIPLEWADGVSMAWNSFVFSPDGRSAAYVVYLPYQGAENATCFV